MRDGLDLFTFNEQLRHFAEHEVPLAHKRLHEEIIVRFYQLVTYSNSGMEHHPIDSGYAQGNWRISTTEQKGDVLGSIESPPSPRSEAQLRYQLRGLKPYQMVWIFNNVHYMPYLEAGHSGAAPAGIVGPALVDIAIFMAELA